MYGILELRSKDNPKSRELEYSNPKEIKSKMVLKARKISSEFYFLKFNQKSECSKGWISE